MINIVMSNPLELGRTGAGRPYGILNDYLKKQADAQRIQYTFLSGMETVRKLYGDASPHDSESLGQAATSDQIIAWDEADLIWGDVFIGCGCASLEQLRRLGSRGSQVRKITTWFSSHYLYASEVLNREYGKVGIRQTPIDQYMMWRDEHEQKLSDVLLVPSEACAETYRRYWPDKVRVVNFGVDSEVYHPAERLPNDFRVLFVGGNWIRKGLPYLVRAWNELRFPNGTLTTVGCDVPPVQIFRHADLRWVQDGELPEIYRKNRVFCLPTFEEGQALAVLEAMASGLAVVTTRESGAPIVDGENGLIVPSGDIGALKAALTRLRLEPETVDRLGRNARKTAQNHTWDDFGAGVLRLCEELAS